MTSLGQVKLEGQWGESTITDSWNEALDDFEKYQRLHSAGTTVVPLEEQDADPEDNTEPDDHDYIEDSEIQMKYEDPRQDGTHTRSDGPSDTVPKSPAMPPGPSGLLTSVRDEGLKNLLMSWYYAGYYTGLYEGQQLREHQHGLEPKTGQGPKVQQGGGSKKDGTQS